MMTIFNQKLLQLPRVSIYSIMIANVLCVSNAFAETLKDPTAPPALLNATPSADNTVTNAPILQSIMIGPQYHAAIINGEKILLGKKYQAATLIKLNEHEAVLRHPDMSTQILSMDFAVNKKIIMPVIDDDSRQQKVKQHSKLKTKPIEISEK